MLQAPAQLNYRHKPGGTMSIVNEPLSYRVTGSTSDEMGRRCTTTFALRNKSSLMVISAYQICTNNHETAGLNTAYMQQIQMLLTKHAKAPRSRRTVLKKAWFL